MISHQATNELNQPQLVKAYQSLSIQWYEHDQQRPKRERRTAHKYFEQLVAGGYGGSYTTVCRFMRTLKQDKTTHNTLGRVNTISWNNPSGAGQFCVQSVGQF